ncbi:MAG: GNAT family N-acetyltransferase [Oscillospiraceae bacterium]|jgi:ribosomal protein S18 acetylase RimI-like enzyme|nr:GNAT family N-acetyltransferase [Oscillospiraceae bacterium]
MSLEIRKATIDDAPAVAEVHTRAYEMAYTGIIPADKLAQMCADHPKRRKENLSRQDHTTHVAVLDHRIVGFFNFGPCHCDDLGERYYQVYAIYLHPDCHRRGIGKAMMDYAHARARERGKTAMMLWVFEENAPARRFYEACGYQPDGTLRIDDFGGRPVKGLRYRREL